MSAELMMPAISLWQPWASLIAVGIKPFETRSWAPSATRIAAKDVGRPAIGIEIEERFCEMAALNLRQEALAL
jgi:hypothetical protein